MTADVFRLEFLDIKRDGGRSRDQVLLYPTPELAAKACGLVLCTDECGKTKSIGRHAHTPKLVFEAPEEYQDVARGGLKYRRCMVHRGEVTIWWHLWTEKSDPPVVYFVPVDMITPITAPGTA